MSKIPVIEFFGPVLQGEGNLIGVPTFFLRTGGCDYVCTHCDSMHAVDAIQVKKNATWWKSTELAKNVVNAMQAADIKLLTLSGGNPAMWDLEEVIKQCHQNDIEVAIETQGTLFKPWIALCDYITVSPKGPGMIKGGTDLDVLESFLFNVLMYRNTENNGLVFKIPVFGFDDLQYATTILRRFAEPMQAPLYLSVGNIDVPEFDVDGAEILRVLDIHAQRSNLLTSLHVIQNAVFTQEEYRTLRACTMLPQLHVLMYGNIGGV